MSLAKIRPALPNTQLSLDDILPARRRQDEKRGRRYQTVFASIKEIGVIEPLLVCPRRDAPGKYVLLDGLQRFLSLKELGQTLVHCTIVTDKEDI